MAGYTMTTDITVAAREVDFVTKFGANWAALQEILGIINPVRKAPGTRLVSSKATMVLENGEVAEGAQIPLSKATIEPVTFADIKIEKFAKGVTVEDVAKYGAKVAVQMTDEAFRNELQGKVLDAFYDFLMTGTLALTEADFQMAISMAIGSVKNKFKEMRKDISKVAVFVNTLDAYRYLGGAAVSLQTRNGIEYLSDFLGATLVLTSEIPQGKVVATPVSNIVLYYVDPSDSEFAQLGLNYRVEGETNLIGYHAEGNYTNATGESYALMGMVLWAEYIDAIAVATIAGE